MAKTSSSTIIDIAAAPLSLPMSEPFEIATGRHLKVENVLIKVKLQDGTTGFGECAPMNIVSGESQAGAIAAARRVAPALRGRDCNQWLRLSRELEHELRGHGSVRAGVEMAVLDAWARRNRLPLWIFFGGTSCRVQTDITVPIMPPSAAAKAARSIWKRGVRMIKIKVGKDFDEDMTRVEAVAEAAPKASLIIDANAGFNAATAIKFARVLARRGIRPRLFEQPVDRRDWDGLAEVTRESGIPVAADETVSSRADAWKMARRQSAQVINIKLMKYGICEALDVARIARAAGLRLMIGGMIESYLAMTCAAHLAAGFGGFDFIDLDTPLWFSRNPMRGVAMKRGGTYDLGGVSAGVGVAPRT